MLIIFLFFDFTVKSIETKIIENIIDYKFFERNRGLTIYTLFAAKWGCQLGKLFLYTTLFPTTQNAKFI